jgi:hypothetical protein
MPSLAAVLQARCFFSVFPSRTVTAQFLQAPFQQKRPY